MANSILELIIQDIETSVAAITTGAGYEHTLTVTRDHPGVGETFANGLVVIELGRADRIESEAQDFTGWWHTFDLVVYSVTDEANSTSWMAVASQMAADIQKKFMVDHTRGGNAIDTLVGPPVADNEDGSKLTRVRVPVMVRYRHSETNAYSAT